jgi:hypothetical protein
MPDQNLKKIFVDDDFNLYVAFADGEMRHVDLKTWVDGVSKIKQDIGFCKQAFIEHGSIISWPTGISIDPEIIYSKGQKISNFPKDKKGNQLPATGNYHQKIISALAKVIKD